MTTPTSRRGLLAGLAGGLAAATAGCSDGGDETTTPGPERDPNVVWEHPAPAAHDLAVAGGTAVLLADSTLEARDTDAGGRRWRTRLEPDPRRSVSLTDDYVVLDGRESVGAVRRRDGGGRWERTASLVSLAGQHEDLLVAWLSDEGIVGLDAATGEVAWRRPGEDPRLGAATVVTERPDAHERLATVAGRDPGSGEERWRYTDRRHLRLVGVTAGVALVHATPATPNHRESVLALDCRDGAVRWRHHGPPTEGEAEVALAGAAVVVATANWALEAHARSGRLLWSVPVEGAATRDTLTASVGADYAVCAHDYGPETDENDEPVILRAIDRGSGAVAWTETLPEYDYDLHLGGGSLYVPVESVQSRDPATGSLRWIEPLTVEAVADGRLYAYGSTPGEDGRRYAFAVR